MEQDRKTDELFVLEHWMEAPWLYQGACKASLSLVYPIKFKGSVKDVGDLWRQARAFTEARLEEIRQVEEEIAFIQEARAVAVECGDCEVIRLGIIDRILARERAVLADLRKGMK